MTALENILLEIKNNGGRWRFAQAIVEEAPDWFSTTDKRNIRRKVYDIERPRRQPKKNPPNFWTPEDVEYLLEHYGKMKTRNLAKILNRSREAMRMKFHAVATNERKALLPNKYISWKNNFKNNDTRARSTTRPQRVRTNQNRAWVHQGV